MGRTAILPTLEKTEVENEFELEAATQHYSESQNSETCKLIPEATPVSPCPKEMASNEDDELRDLDIVLINEEIRQTSAPISSPGMTVTNPGNCS